MTSDEAETYVNSLISRLEDIKRIGQMTLLGNTVPDSQDGVRVSLVQ